MPKRHEMIFQGQVDSGAEEWFCPSCGRRMLMRCTPKFETLLLEHGDDTAVHLGAKRGVRLNDVAVAPGPALAVSGSETQWLDDNGIAWDSSSA